MTRSGAWLERLAILGTSLVVSIGLIALLSGFFAARDQAGLSAAGSGPGQALRDLGHQHLRAGQPRPAYDSDPPTSGAHVAVAVGQDRSPLSDDQLLQALEVGNVVVAYGSPNPPAGLVAVARAVTVPFSPALAAAGQAVILDHRPGTTGIIALAWAHRLALTQPDDPALHGFLSYWLGRGAPARCC